MAYYRICPYCGCNLDPDEKCDCREREEESKKQKEEMKQLLQTEHSGQMAMIFE